MERGAPLAGESLGCPSLADALWRVREGMHRLAAALAGAGDLPAAIDEVRVGEVLRAAESEELARTIGLPPDASLADLAAAVGEPWPTILFDHLMALRRLYTEITGRAAATDRRFWQQSLDEFLR